jgi:hypothetical protein
MNQGPSVKMLSLISFDFCLRQKWIAFARQVLQLNLDDDKVMSLNDWVDSLG